MIFSEYVVEKAIEKLKNDLSRSFNFRLEGEKRRQQAVNGRVDEESASKSVVVAKGFNEQDLQDNSRMLQIARKKLNDNFSDIIKSFQAGEGFDLSIKKGENGKKVQLAGTNFMGTLKTIAPKIAAHDESFLGDIRKRIHEKCIKEGIDPDKFAFDIATVEKMKEQNRIDTKS